MMNKEVGQTRINNFGSTMMVVGYRKYKDIDVYFSEYDWTAEGVSYGAFKKGEIKCVYEPRVYGVGYTGEGDYEISENGTHTKVYSVWKDMLRRCYNPKLQEKYPTYKGCSVVKEWHNFQNFAKWYEENYYEVEGQTMCLDKDIIVKGNKVYSPSTCVFVPQDINKLFTKRDRTRGDLPIGVVYHKQANKYLARCKNGTGTRRHLGLYKTPEEAYQVYKVAKEKHIKEVAEEYKDKIPSVLYDAMMNYEVEITD